MQMLIKNSRPQGRKINKFTCNFICNIVKAKTTAKHKPMIGALTK